MNYPFNQGYLDSLCGIYSIINADKIVNRSKDEESQELFNEIISYLHRKRKLKDTIIEGIAHRQMTSILKDVVKDRFAWGITGNGFTKITDWWNYYSLTLSDSSMAIIISFGGRENHLSVIKSMNDKTMTLFDSAEIKRIRKSSCRLAGQYKKDDKYIIYPAQSFICWKRA